MIFPSFSFDEKCLRRDAVEQMDRCDEAWERWRSRPLGCYPREAEQAHEGGIQREERLAKYALDRTNRGTPLDSPWPCQARERVRSAIRMVRAHRQRGDEDNARFYLARLQKHLQFYRCAVARCRQAQMEEHSQPAE